MSCPLFLLLRVILCRLPQLSHGAPSESLWLASPGSDPTLRNALTANNARVRYRHISIIGSTPSILASPRHGAMVTPTASGGGRGFVIDTEEAFTVLIPSTRRSVIERVSPRPVLPTNETVPTLKPRAGVDVPPELDMPAPPSARQAPPPPWQLKAPASSSSVNPASTVRPLSLALPIKAPPEEDSAAYLPSEEVLKRDKLEQYRLVCSQITPHVYVGGEDVARSFELLERHGITHVVNCAGPSMENVFPERFLYMKLQLHDSKEEDITWFVYEVIDFVEEARRRNPKARVLLHCLQGVSRSISFAIAYLMWSTPCGFMEAFNEVKRIRPIASPNTGFICCLLEWQRYRSGEVFSSRSIMFRVAYHGDHDSEKAVVKACRALDGSRGLIEPHTAHLSHKGVFVIQAPSTWPHAEFYVWRGRKASDMALRVALDFVESVQRLEGWAGDVVVVDETQAAADTTFRILLGGNTNTGEQTGDVVVPMRFHDLLTASAEERRTTPSPPRRKSPSSPTRAGQASRSSVVGGGREGARAQPLTGFNSEQNALKSVPCQLGGRIACAADGCRKYSLYRLECGGDVQPNWEDMGLFDEDDLESDGIYLLSEDAEQDCPLYIWIGSQATDSVKLLESACTGGKLNSDAVGISEWQLPPGRVVHVEREGAESDVFWQVFEATTPGEECSVKQVVPRIGTDAHGQHGRSQSSVPGAPEGHQRIKGPVPILECAGPPASSRHTNDQDSFFYTQKGELDIPIRPNNVLSVIASTVWASMTAVLEVSRRFMTEVQAPGAGPPRRLPSPLREPPGSGPTLDDSASSEHASPPSPVSPDNEELWWLYEAEPISPDGGPQNFQDLSVVQKVSSSTKGGCIFIMISTFVKHGDAELLFAQLPWRILQCMGQGGFVVSRELSCGHLGIFQQFRAMIWVHKRRLLGRYKLFHKYLEYCPHRPSSALARSYAHSYARKLSRLRRTRRSILRPPLSVLGLSGFFNIRGQEGGMGDEAAGSGRGQRVDTRDGEGEGVGGGVQQPQVALMPDLAPAPGASSSSYLIEIFRLQPFAAAAYLRALLYCWFSGVFLQVQAALSFSRDQPDFIERAAWQWLLCQLVLQVLQAPARLKLYLRLLGVSHSGDAEEASNRIRLLVTSKLWMTSQALGTVFHTVAAFGPVFLWLVKSTSPVRRDVLSVCCANLLIFILRTALTFVIMHSILEARNARPKPLKRGLTKESIAKLKRMESNTEDDAGSMCSICLCNFTQGDSMLLLPCDERHTFHDECITQWLVKNSSCPLCQRDVATE